MENKDGAEPEDDDVVLKARKRFDKLVSFYKDSKIQNAPDVLQHSRNIKAPEAISAAVTIFYRLVGWVMQHEHEIASRNNIGVEFDTDADRDLVVLREAIANILKNAKPPSHEDIFKKISDGLSALNHGDPSAFFRPIHVKGRHKKSEGFEKDQEMAVLWMYYYWGQFEKKEAALAEVAGRLGIESVTLRKWTKKTLPRLQKRRKSWAKTTLLEDAKNAGILSIQPTDVEGADIPDGPGDSAENMAADMMEMELQQDKNSIDELKKRIEPQLRVKPEK